MLNDLITDPDVLVAFAGLIGTLFTFLKGTEVYQARVGLKRAALIGLAERAVAWQWHNYLRSITDLNSPSNTDSPKLKQAKHDAHNSAIKQIIAEATDAGIASHPVIVAAKRGDTKALDAAVVTAVKRFKAGNAGYPTTKGQ